LRVSFRKRATHHRATLHFTSSYEGTLSQNMLSYKSTLHMLRTIFPLFHTKVHSVSHAHIKVHSMSTCSYQGTLNEHQIFFVRICHRLKKGSLSFTCSCLGTLNEHMFIYRFTEYFLYDFFTRSYKGSLSFTCSYKGTLSEHVFVSRYNE